jgi:SAM-dependent methyltransferase
MDKAEFDKFADEYRSLHANNIRASGESPDFFAEYKVVDAALLAKSIGLKDSAAILDFGAGVGNSVPYFKKHFPDSRLTCVDVSTRSTSINQQRFPGMAECTTFDGATLPFPDNSFDIAFAANVFHHIDASLHVPLLSEMRRVLIPGGFIVVFEHNPWNPLTVRAVDSCPFDENAVLIKADVLATRVASAGLIDIGVKYRIFFPGLLRRLRFLERYLTWLPLGAQYYVSGIKE